MPLTPEIEAIARRVIWFETPQLAIANPGRFVAYMMTYGTYRDVAVIRESWSEDDLRAAVDAAPPGIFDALLGVLEHQARPLPCASDAGANL